MVSVESASIGALEETRRRIGEGDQRVSSHRFDVVVGEVVDSGGGTRTGGMEGPACGGREGDSLRTHAGFVDRRLAQAHGWVQLSKNVHGEPGRADGVRCDETRGGGKDTDNFVGVRQCCGCAFWRSACVHDDSRPSLAWTVEQDAQKTPQEILANEQLCSALSSLRG